MVTATVTGTFALAHVSEQASTNAPLADCEVSYRAGEVTVIHTNGVGIETSALSVVVRNDTGASRVPFAIARGDGDARFEPGERATFGSVGESTRVTVVTTNAVVCGRTVVPPGASRTPTSTPTPEDGPPTATIESVTDDSRCSKPRPRGGCKGSAATDVARFDVEWRAADDVELRDVTIRLIEDGTSVVDTASPRVSGTSASGTVTLSHDGGYGNQYTIELVVTDSAGQTDSATVTDTADGTDP